jgi:hypothetical protein
MKSNCFDEYEKERKRLMPHQIDDILASGKVASRKGRLAECLGSKGMVVFPHTYLHSCGAFIAAAVHAALDSGADQVLAIGVLHSLTPHMLQARMEERAKKRISDTSLRGVHGPEISSGAYWQAEYSLLSFLFLWNEEVKRRGGKAPKLVTRYPYLANRSPETLPGVHELEALSKDSAIVMTADFCHNGVAYGHSKEATIGFGEHTEKMAEEYISSHLKILQEGDFDAYYQDCIRIYSDAYDVGCMSYHLRGGLRSEILDLAIVDVAPLFEGAPTPSWVAASLVAMHNTSF